MSASAVTSVTFWRFDPRRGGRPCRGRRRSTRRLLFLKRLLAATPPAFPTAQTTLFLYLTSLGPPRSNEKKKRTTKKKKAGTSLASTDGRVGSSRSPGSGAERAQRRAPLIRHEGDSRRAFNCTTDSAQSVYSCAPLVKVTVF